MKEEAGGSNQSQSVIQQVPSSCTSGFPPCPQSTLSVPKRSWLNFGTSSSDLRRNGSAETNTQLSWLSAYTWSPSPIEALPFTHFSHLHSLGTAAARCGLPSPVKTSPQFPTEHPAQSLHSPSLGPEIEPFEYHLSLVSLSYFNILLRKYHSRYSWKGACKIGWGGDKRPLSFYFVFP